MPLIQTIGSGAARGFGRFGLVPRGLTSNDAVFSAKEIYASGVSVNGNYWVKGNGSTPRQVYCLMDKMGGGWTRVTRITLNYNYANNNFYTYNVGSSFDSSVTSMFNLAPSLFSNVDGTDLSVMYRVVGGGTGGNFPGNMGGAIWQGYNLSDAFNTNLDTGNLRTNGNPKYSTDGINFINYTNSSPLGKANSAWNIVHANFTGGVGYYGQNDQTSGFILGHGGPGGSEQANGNYGYIENFGSVGQNTDWAYVDIYIRKDV